MDVAPRISVFFVYLIGGNDKVKRNQRNDSESQSVERGRGETVFFVVAVVGLRLRVGFFFRNHVDLNCGDLGGDGQVGAGGEVSSVVGRVGDGVGDTLPGVGVRSFLEHDGGLADQAGFGILDIDLSGGAPLLDFGAILGFESVIVSTIFAGLADGPKNGDGFLLVESLALNGAGGGHGQKGGDHDEFHFAFRG